MIFILTCGYFCPDFISDKLSIQNQRRKHGVPLVRSHRKVSPLCLGCMNFGGKASTEDSYAIIDKAIDEGINFLDTANVYSRGHSEEVTGEALKRNGKRVRLF